MTCINAVIVDSRMLPSYTAERVDARALVCRSNSVVRQHMAGKGREHMAAERQLEASEVKVLCERATGVRLLARADDCIGNDRWRRLSRQGMVVETVAMGVRPLDPERCYVIARAGLADEKERRVTILECRPSFAADFQAQRMHANRTLIASDGAAV